MDKETIDSLVRRAVVAELDGCDFLSVFDYEELAREYNGIGPEWVLDRWRAKVSDYLELFAPAALIHDMRYSRSDGMRTAFYFANYEFRDNCLKLANAAYPWYSWKRYRARAVALILFDFVDGPGGWIAWLDASRKNLTRAETSHKGADGIHTPFRTSETPGGSLPLRENSFAVLALFAAIFLFVGCCRIVTIEKHDPKPVFDATGTNVVSYVDGGYDFRYRSIGLVTDVDGIEATKDEKVVTIKVKNLKTDVSKENKEIVGASGTALGNVVEKAIQGAKK